MLRQFFRFARTHKVVLVDPPAACRRVTTRIHRPDAAPRRAARPVPPVDRRPRRPPHEALLGILALLHGASSREVRQLRCEDIDHAARTVRWVGDRSRCRWTRPAGRCCSGAWRTGQAQRTDNPHVIVTRGTKARTDPASTAYFSHLLDACGIPPKILRCTRLVELVNTIDPKIVAAAFGMNPEGVMFYLADHVDDVRLPAAPSNPANP